MEQYCRPCLFLLLLSLLLSPPCAAAAGDDDGAVMAKLAEALSPTPRGWSSTDPSDHCNWSDVSCDSSGRVSSINLPLRSLSGQLPADINRLSRLTTLYLQRNKLSGPIPSFANLANLQEINLNGNGFSSVPPSFLAGLTSLQTLTISDNPALAQWSLPDHLAECTGLVTLQASNASLVGQIPDIFTSLPNLQSVRLSYNNLTGTLPPSLAGSAIQNLCLNNQQIGLSGRLDVMGAMTQLSQVWLHSNSFSGPIPDLAKCESLFDLQLRDNHITGVVPTALTSLPKLANVTLQNNKLQGPVPVFGENVAVSLGSTNSFCDSKPGTCDPQVTTLLMVAGALGYPMTLAESWEGNDPCLEWTFVACDAAGKSVTSINFAKQHWDGTISPAIANLTSLRTLVLNDNKLTGSIPQTLTGLTQLQVLDVSNNNLTGKIPNFSATVKVNTSGNPFIGIELSTASGGGDLVSGSETATQWQKRFTVIAAVGVAVGAVACVSWLFLTNRCTRIFKWSRSSHGDKEKVDGDVNGYDGFSSEQPDKSGGEKSSNVQVNYDGDSIAIPIEVLQEVTNNFSVDKILGKGGFGFVYKGELPDGTQLAVKRMESNTVSTKGLNEFEAEIAVLKRVRHRHLVTLLGFCINGRERILVYEYMAQGTLGQHLFNYQKSGFAPLTWMQRLKIALDVARGVEYLHSLARQSFIHRDLKPSNILLGDNMRAKVSDFGLVKNAPDGKHSLETRLAGTFGYLAPEYATTGRVTTKVDVYAFGVILMELLSGQKALDDSLSEEKCHLVIWFRKVLNNRDTLRDSLDPSMDPDKETFESICKVAELAGHCTAREPNQRPDMSHVVNVLAPLVEQWKPTTHDEEESFSIDLDLSLSQALEKWQSSEGSTTMTEDELLHSHSSSSPIHPTGFGRAFSSDRG